MGGYIFDTHSHYLDEQFDPDREYLLNNLESKNVKTIVECSAALEDSYKIVNLIKKYPFMYGAVGVHPENSGNLPQNWIIELETLARSYRIKAIGEIGLDYHTSSNPSKATQLDVFEKQLKLAKDLELPVIIHDRNAHSDTLKFLNIYRNKAVVHCFSGNLDMAQKVISWGMYIGLGGVVTFNNAKAAKDVAKNIPLDRILLETDAPYMAPEPFRGKRNDSSLIYHVAKVIAELRGETVDKILEVTYNNAEVFFNIE